MKRSYWYWIFPVWRFVGPESPAAGRKQYQITMAAERGAVDLMLVISLIEADDSVVENEMCKERMTVHSSLPPLFRL